MKYLFVTLAFFLFQHSPAVAFVTTKTVLSDYAKGGMDKKFALIYLNGLGEGIRFGSLILESEGREELYCPPNDLILDADGYFEIFKIEYIQNKDFYIDKPPAIPLLMGLKYTYPCAKERDF